MAELFTNKDLKYSYEWNTPPEDHKLKGDPDKYILDRNEGNEVLYMINTLMKNWSMKDISQGHKIESLIHKAPPDLHSQERVKNWIFKNWETPGRRP